jgi:hypothetical protein
VQKFLLFELYLYGIWQDWLEAVNESLKYERIRIILTIFRVPVKPYFQPLLVKIDNSRLLRDIKLFEPVFNDLKGS